jgi:hypothetical protein
MLPHMTTVIIIRLTGTMIPITILHIIPHITRLIIHRNLMGITTHLMDRITLLTAGIRGGMKLNSTLSILIRAR